MSQDTALRFFSWDCLRWFRSDTFLSRPLDVQAAYMNLCFAAFLRQPDVTIPDDDALLQSLAGARSPDQWASLKPSVLVAPWERREKGWWHPVVAEKYALVADIQANRHRAGKEGARARYEVPKAPKRRRKRSDQLPLDEPLDSNRIAEAVADAEFCQGEREIERERGTEQTDNGLGPFDSRPWAVSGNGSHSVPNVVSIADRYVECFNVVFDRRVSATPEIVAKVGARLKDGYQGWQIIALPVLVAANTKDRAFLKSVQPDWPLRDGKHPRSQPGGGTTGAVNWLERELCRLDRTFLSDHLLLVSREFGVEDLLLKSGVRVRVEEG